MARAARGKGEGSVYQRKDERWVAQVEAGRNAQGRRRYVRAVRKTKAEALTELRNLQRQVDRGAAIDRTSTVGTYLEWWLENCSTEWTPGTVKTYRGAVRNWITPHIGSVRLSRLTPNHIQQMLTALANRGLSPRTRKSARAVLVAALAWAERSGVVDRNVARLAPGPRIGSKLDDSLDADEAKVVLAAAAGDRLEAAAYLGLKLGMRIGEIAALQWSDVDLDGKELTIPKSKTPASERTIPLVAGTLEALRLHEARQAGERAYAGDLWRESGYVFTHEDGRRCHPDSIRRWWNKLLKRAGVEHRRFHASRHTAATLLLDTGVPLEVVSAILGHSSLDITANVYARVTSDAKRRALRKLEDT